MLNKRKYIRLLPKCLSIIGCLFFIVSCKKETQPITGSISPIEQEQKTSPLRNAIVERGFKDSAIQDKGSYYLVENDIIFLKADSAKYIGKDNPVAHQRHSNLVDFYVHPIAGGQNLRMRCVRYCIQEALKNPANGGIDDWEFAIREAAQEWQTMTGTAIMLAETPDLAEADIFFFSDQLFSTVPLADNMLAVASMPPNAGVPGGLIAINLDFNSNAALSFSAKKLAMVHELGHTLGFYHTDSNEGTLIPGTPSSDLNSVMFSTSAGFAWSGFSTGDLAATRILYPSLKGTISDFVGGWGLPDSGFGAISWNAGALSGSTVKVELFRSWLIGGEYQLIYAREISANASNTGYLEEGINYATDLSYDWSVIKITSNANPSQFTFSNRFPLQND